MELKETLKLKRKEQNLTQEQLAEKIWVSKKTISNWETGKTTPDIDSLIRLARLFNLSLDHLLLEESEIVENIKKQEEVKAIRKLFLSSYMINYIIGLIILTGIYFGEVSLFAAICLCAIEFINFIPLLYYSEKLKKLNEDPMIKQLYRKNKPLFFLTVVPAISMIVLFVARLIVKE